MFTRFDLSIKSAVIAVASFSAAFGSGMAAYAAPLTINCGAAIKSKEKVQFQLFQTNSQAQVIVPGSQVTVKVPAGKHRCIKLRFEGGMGCQASGTSECTLRVDGPNGEFLQPVGGVSFLAGDNLGGAHSFEFVNRLGPGTYTFRVKANTNAATTLFFMPQWHMTLQVTK